MPNLAISAGEYNLLLIEILSKLKADELLTIPGIYEIVSEHYNNSILDLYENRSQAEG